MKKFKDFETQIILIFVITLLTGALRKWLFTSGITGNIILFVQLLLPFIFTIYYQGLSLLYKNNLLKFYLLFLFILVFNPLNLTIFHGILGVILHFGFWWLISYYQQNRFFIDIRPLIPFVILFCTFELLLGFVQYQLPSDHVLNKYAAINQLGENQSIALVGNSVRVTGTFSYISGYTSFLIFSIFFIWTLIRADYNKQIVSFLLFGTLMAAFMTGSRSSVYITVTIIFLIIFSEFTIKTINNFFKSLILPFIILIILFLAKGSIGIENMLTNAYYNFNERRVINAQSGEQNQRIFGDIQELFVNYRGNYPFFGVGLGSTYQGATSVFGISDYVKEYGYYENELPRIVLEGGFFLLILRIGLFIWLLSWLKFNKLSKFILFILFVYSIPIVFNIYNSLFLALGLIFTDNILLHKRYISTFKL